MKVFGNYKHYCRCSSNSLKTGLYLRSFACKKPIPAIKDFPVEQQNRLNQTVFLNIPRKLHKVTFLHHREELRCGMIFVSHHFSFVT